MTTAAELRALADEVERQKIMQRFMAKISPEPNSGCWLWDGATVDSKHGPIPRGLFSIGGKPILAHRAAYVLFRGAIPTGLLVCHRCDIPLCANPDHLFLGTHRDNMRDMVEKGRSFLARHPEKLREQGRRFGLLHGADIAGAKNFKAKLSPSDVASIKAARAAGVGPSRLALQFGVDRTTIQRIVRGDLWRPSKRGKACALRARAAEMEGGR